jgi:hypothetical protein
LNLNSIAVEEDEHNWDSQLPMALLAYRTSVHEATNTTPFSLTFGRDPILSEDILFNSPEVAVPQKEKEYTSHLRAKLQQAYGRVRAHM